MAENFKIVEVNPNDNSGGGGCLCSPGKDTDCKGPYAVFFATEMEDNLSPFPVVSVKCAAAIVQAAKVDVLAGGEKDADAIEAAEADFAEWQAQQETSDRVVEDDSGI